MLGHFTIGNGHANQVLRGEQGLGPGINDELIDESRSKSNSARNGRKNRNKKVNYRKIDENVQEADDED
uniref:CSON008150 protein n=1 Tax=Culicoides sonorensis TaxID=179676 RepID=A0A336LYL3_CULSO